MATTSQQQTAIAVAVVVLLAVILFAVYAVSAKDNTAYRRNAETYITANIDSLSPRAATVGSTYRVSSVEWIDDENVLVTYTDGTRTLRGRGRVTNDQNDSFLVSGFTLDTDANSSESFSSTDSSDASTSAGLSSSQASFSGMSSSINSFSSRSSSSSMQSSTSSMSSSRTRAGLGQFCGGIAGIMCESGLTCHMDATYPDAGGTCIQA